MQVRLTEANKSAESADSQNEVINALREEGQKLAVKQSQMEQSVRAARIEARDTQAELDRQVDEKEKALDRISHLETEQKKLKEDLASAKSGESRSSKLEIELSKMREEGERVKASNLSLEQQVKEYKAQVKELTKEVDDARRGAALESERESSKMKREHGDAVADLEQKLRTSEREANVREDALRHEVNELRKRWQDSVRRADALSMDVQESTAPLMRQLESMDRQSRARAATWAEMETKLRSDIEELVVESENVTRERNELRATSKRLERLNKELEKDLASSKASLEELTFQVNQLNNTLEDKETEERKLKEKWSEVERTSNEGVSKVRSEMMKTVMENEERYESQVQALQKELKEERNSRIELENQVKKMAETSGIAPTAVYPVEHQQPKKEEKQKKLRSTTDQAEILAGALSGWDDWDDDEQDEDDEEDEPVSNSVAAMEQLAQNLRGSQIELEALRKQLTSSEVTRSALVKELGETRSATEKLPLFEKKVKELTTQNREMELEIRGLKDDIEDIRGMYRSQLNALLEEKASAQEPKTDDKPVENGEAHKEEGMSPS